MHQNFLLILFVFYTDVVPKSKNTPIFTWLAYLKLASGPYSGIFATGVTTIKMRKANPLDLNFLLILHLLYTKVVPKSKNTPIFAWLAYLKLAQGPYSGVLATGLIP